MADFGGRYTMVRRIGAGGMGEVWLAHDEQLHDRPVAIKIMQAALLPNADDVARFEREMHLAAIMQHPNIVTLFTTGTHNGAPYMVMEYLDGQDLGTAPPTPDPARVAAIGRAVCGALSYAHGRGVIHRDIKPGNLFQCTSGQVKITDFGIAKAMAGTNLSSTGVIAGTPAYISPEQWRGEPPAFSNDIWATGCALYKFLSGRLPREYGTVGDYMVAAVRGDPVPELQTMTGAPTWVCDAVMAMLTVDPRRRPSAGECETLLAGPPTVRSAPASSLGSSSSIWRPAPPPAMPTFPGRGAGTGPRSTRPPAGRQRRGAPHSGRRRPAWIAASVGVLAVAIIGGQYLARNFPSHVATNGVQASVSSIATAPGADAVALPESSWQTVGGAAITPHSGGVFEAQYQPTYWGGLFAKTNAGCNYRLSGQARVISGGGYGFTVWASIDSSGTPHGQSIQYDTGVGGYRDVNLPDGSETGAIYTANLDSNWHTVTIQVLNGQYTSAVDGQVIFTGTMTGTCTSDVFIRLWNSSDSEFRDLTVTKLS